MASILEGMPCRIEHKSWINSTEHESGHWGESTYDYGTFLDFNTDHEEYDNGPGMFPVAIIILESGQLVSVSVNRVKILEVNDEHSKTMGDTKDPDDSVNI